MHSLFAVWQEIFDNGGSLRQNTIIDVWKSWGKGWEAELSDVTWIESIKKDLFTYLSTNKIPIQVTRLGFDAVLSAPWYLNYMKYGSDWVKFYKVNPLDFYGSPEQKSRLLGGQVSTINLTNKIQRISGSCHCFRSAYGGSLSIRLMQYRGYGLEQVLPVRDSGQLRRTTSTWRPRGSRSTSAGWWREAIPSSRL